MIKIGLLLLLAVVVLGVAGVFVAAVLLMSIATKPRRYTAERSLRRVTEQGLLGEFASLIKEEIQILSYDDYVLHGLYLPAKEKSNRYVVITHGITDTCYGSSKYANLYHRLGFHVVMYDMRNHGSNVKTYTSMGVRECRDLRAVIEYVRKRFGVGTSEEISERNPVRSAEETSERNPVESAGETSERNPVESAEETSERNPVRNAGEISIGIHGESLGCATSILCLDDNLNLDFCVADCGYSDLIELMRHLVKNEYHLPAFFVPIGDKLVKLFYGYSFSEIRPIDNLKENHTPILFLHGAADTYVPTYMSQDMYEANVGYKEICLFEGAKHAKSIASNPEKYYEVLKGFLGKVFS